jgi:hypothetical protein
MRVVDSCHGLRTARNRADDAGGDLGRFEDGPRDSHDLICAKTGGPCYYLGRDMKTAHTGLGITEDDWTRASAAMKVTLDKFNVGAKEQAELFAIIGTLKPDIVGR